jgi:hypothetical protein
MTTMKKTILIAAAALTAIPALLAAQTGAKADANVRVRTDASASAGRRDGDDGEARARSGAAASADARAEVRLDASRRALSDGGRREPSRAEIAAGAKAMAQGAAESDLSLLAEHARRGRSLTASANALARLGSRSGDFHASAAAIAARLEQNASDRAITRLAATGNVDAMLHGADVNAAGSATAGLGGILRGGAGVTGGLGGHVGGIIP